MTQSGKTMQKSPIGDYHTSFHLISILWSKQNAFPEPFLYKCIDVGKMSKVQGKAFAILHKYMNMYQPLTWLAMATEMMTAFVMPFMQHLTLWRRGVLCRFPWLVSAYCSQLRHRRSVGLRQKDRIIIDWHNEAWSPDGSVRNIPPSTAPGTTNAAEWCTYSMCSGVSFLKVKLMTNCCKAAGKLFFQATVHLTAPTKENTYCSVHVPLSLSPASEVIFLENEIKTQIAQTVLLS